MNSLFLSENIINILVICAAIMIAAALAAMMRKKMRKGSSCCGEHEALVEHIRAHDTNPRHYPYHYRLRVEGMVCADCAGRVENAFNGSGEMLASADLWKKEVMLSSERELGRRETAQIVDTAGCTLLDFEKAAD